MSLRGKIAVVTGGSKGIGKATALRLAQEGASVVVNYNSDSKAADELVSQIGSDRALAVQADASSVASLEHLVQKAIDKFGKIDILVPNAGIMPMADLAHMTEEVFDKTYALNVKGPMFLAQVRFPIHLTAGPPSNDIQKALPHMPSGSSIIFLSTTLTFAHNIVPGALAYISSKGAVEQMVRVLSRDLAANHRIRVNAVAPGPTGTELFFEGKSEALLQSIAGLNPFKRLGTPEDIAEVVTFLGGEGAKWVNGQTIRVNGGHA